MRRRTLATLIRRAAKERLEDAGRWDDDEEMVQVCIQDAKDLRTIAKLVDENRLASAWNRACDLDTIVRDQLPEEFWTTLEKHGCR